jgi:hypothetical protein
MESNKITYPLGTWHITATKVLWFPNYYILDKIPADEQRKLNLKNGYKMDYNRKYPRVYREK